MAKLKFQLRTSFFLSFGSFRKIFGSCKPRAKLGHRNGFSLGQGGVHSKFWEKSAVGERFESSAAQPTPDQVRLCFPARCRVPANIWRPLKVAMDEAAPPLPPPAFPPPALCARRHVQQWHRSRCAPAPNARLPDVMVVSEGCAIRYMLSSAWPHSMCV